MSARDAAPELSGHSTTRDQPVQEAKRAVPSGPPDTDLVQRAQKGDKAAFRQLIERHQRRVYQLALGIVKDHEDALDVVQETFVKVHNNLPTFKGDSAFYTWVYRIAYNVAIDAVRKNKGDKVEVDENTLTDEGSQYDPYSPQSPSPQKAALRGELGAKLQEALAKLGENHRAILVLREIDGLSYEELAQVLKIPKGTVMSRLFHARQKMQQALRGYVGDDLAQNDDETEG